MKSSWCSSYGLLWLGDCSIELIEETEDDQAEAFWVKQFDCVNTFHMEYGVGEQYDKIGWNRQWHAAHREYSNAKRREYHAANREVQNAKMRRRVICELCGTESKVTHLRRHQQSAKCKKLSQLKK
tara:strand:+ start:3917 stop:4294 length:378 start_codon:yes stop_codon:yes gene_type:complete